MYHLGRGSGFEGTLAKGILLVSDSTSPMVTWWSQRAQDVERGICGGEGSRFLLEGNGGVRKRAHQSSLLTAGKENIEPLPQAPHGAIPLALTPPGKVS